MNLDNNIPAYPMHEDATATRDMPQKGMTLLDHFAGLAMNGLCMADKSRAVTESTSLAQVSYVIAEAMLEARKNYIK